jgi:hypothetical protein
VPRRVLAHGRKGRRCRSLAPIRNRWTGTVAGREARCVGTCAVLVAIGISLALVGGLPPASPPVRPYGHGLLSFSAAFPTAFTGSPRFVPYGPGNVRYIARNGLTNQPFLTAQLDYDLRARAFEIVSSSWWGQRTQAIIQGAAAAHSDRQPATARAAGTISSAAPPENRKSPGHGNLVNPLNSAQ